MWTVPQKERFNSSYSDFVTRYTAISSTNQMSQESEYFALEKDDALTMNLGINPLMQFGLKSVREKMLREILTALQKVNYVPFDSSTIGNPALEPGDVLQFTGGHADETQASCITSITYKINGKHSLKCVGKNPKLSAAKSKNDKNITGLINSVESGRMIIYNFVNVSPFVIGQSLTKVMDIDFTATEETSASFQCEMLLEVIKPEETTEVLPELFIVYKMNDETIDTFMPTKTCIYGKHIVTLFLPISKVVENSFNTFSMYLKISDGSISIGETQIRATISGQGLAAGLGDWNGHININENMGFVAITDVPCVTDVYADSLSVTFPKTTRNGLTQMISNVMITEQPFTVNTFTDRTWIAEILRTFVLTSVRGNPKYNGYITVNNEEQFTLRKRYAIVSAPNSMDYGYVESLVVDTSFYESVDTVEINGCYTVGFRLKFTLNAKDALVEVADTIDTSKGRYELKGTTEEPQIAVTGEIDEGFLEITTIDTSAFDGVKGVRFEL